MAPQGYSTSEDTSAAEISASAPHSAPAAARRPAHAHTQDSTNQHHGHSHSHSHSRAHSHSDDDVYHHQTEAEFVAAAEARARNTEKHRHSHRDSPYERDCQSPTTAASMSFLAAFFGALSGVSVPTHVTGYFLQDPLPTVLLWLSSALGVIYGSLSATCFFKTLEHATDEDYRKENLTKTSQIASKRFKSFLWVHRLLPLTALGVVAVSVSLWAIGLKQDRKGWDTWCVEHSLLVVAGNEETTTTSDHSKIVLCEEMYLNQRFILLISPIILIILEMFRFFTTKRFLAHLATDTEEK